MTNIDHRKKLGTISRSLNAKTRSDGIGMQTCIYKSSQVIANSRTVHLKLLNMQAPLKMHYTMNSDKRKQ